MSRIFVASLAAAAALAAAMSNAGAHDATRPLPAFDPNAEIEDPARAVNDNIIEAKQAGVGENALETARFVVWLNLAWPQHDVTVCFWNGTTELQDFVMKTANVWTEHADLNFVYQTDGKNNICRDGDPTSADIRINLDPDAPLSLFVNQEGNAEGAWSYIGRVSGNPKFLVSMNLRDVAEARTKNMLWTLHAIRHEFGHALGLMHEHQRALCDPWFDYEKTAKLYGWSVEETKRQVGKFSDSATQYLKVVGDYDRESIMQYNFRKEQFKQVPGQDNPCLRETPIDDLSEKDIEGIQVLYGVKPGVAAIASRSSAGPDLVPAQASPEEAVKVRADLAKIQSDLAAEALTGNRSGSGDGADPVAKREAFDAVVSSIAAFEDLIPPR